VTGRALLIALAALAAAPAASSAHSLVRINGSELSYQSVDATSLNTLTVDQVGTEIHIRDPTVDGGMDQGTCRPGDVDANGYVIEAFCPAAGIQSLRIDVAEREDKVTVNLNLPTTLLGGPGADVLTSGGGDDVIIGDDGNDTIVAGAGNDQVSAGTGDDAVDGSAGNDVLQGGQGADRLDGGEGDDDLRVRDGATDQATCGAGADKADVDQLDQVGGDCEAITRTDTSVAQRPGAAPGTAAAPGTPSAPSPSAAGAGAGPDRTGPRVQVGGATLQRLGTGAVVRILATSSERGAIAASGFLDVDGLQLPVLASRKRVSVAGGGVELIVKLTRTQRRQAQAALRKHKRVFLRVGVVATDEAGNSREVRSPRIRLRR
jgi:hypothetical protein